MPRPVVGITTYREPARWGAWDQSAVLLPASYADAVVAAGAAAVLLPPDDDGVEVVGRIDALILAGGADLGPKLYGKEPHPTTDSPRVVRDASEIALYRAARERSLPVLGICRGLQVMAVAHGGSLIQDLPTFGSGSLHREAPGAYTVHSARIDEGTLASRILGAGLIEVNSSHHQAVADAGALLVTGRAEDGTVEICEDPESAFVIGVQWHPEADTDSRLFEALVSAIKR